MVLRLTCFSSVRNFELATEYLFSWFGLGIEEAERLGYRVIDIPKEAATLENLLDALGAYRFSALFLGGHGGPDVFTGQDYEVILRACENDDVMTGTLSMFLSCFVGQELLPSMDEKDAVATVGWATDFRFMVDTSYPILEDPLAEPFKELVFDITSRVLRGQKIRVVWEGGIAKCNEWIAKLSPRQEYIWSQVIGCIEHDRDGLIALGNKEVYATPPVTLAPMAAVFGPLVIGTLLTVAGQHGKLFYPSGD